MNNPEEILSLLRESEHHGELVLRQRAELVHMDRVSNKNREAFNAIKRRPEKESVYLCTGNMFIKYKIPEAKAVLEKDQKDIVQNVEKLRSDIKKSVERIQTIEGKGERFDSSFNLNPISQDEMKGLNVLLKNVNLSSS